MNIQTNTLARLASAIGMGNPYRWQADAHSVLLSGQTPGAIKAPTGAGKTAFMLCWLAALMDQAVARRVTLQRRYVVAINRRALVDSASDMAMRLVSALELPELADLRAALSCLSATGSPLVVSTLRGQRADSFEWATDPSAPAIIASTPDMLGSRLLFGGYGLGRSRRATHAGLLGVDTLVVHDEAHLSPSLSELLRTIEIMAAPGAQLIGRPALAFVEMSATPRGLPVGRAVIECDPGSSPDLLRRMSAVKALRIVEGGIATVVKDAVAAAKSGKATLVYITSPEDAGKIAAGISKTGFDRVATLTGTMRGIERDALVMSDPFSAFLPGDGRTAGGAVLVATAAGEIGIDIDADVLLCDAVTLDRMAQRAGRCNRRGLGRGVVNVYPAASKAPSELEDRIALAMVILAGLPVNDGDLDASPLTLSVLLSHPQYADAIEPAAQTRELVRDVVDLYSLTSAARDIAQPARSIYIHGIRQDEPEISFAWRMLPLRRHADWMDAWPLSSRELARLPLRKADKLVELLSGGQKGTIVALIVASDGGVETVVAGEYSRRLRNLRDGDTVVMSCLVGGLSAGIPDPSSTERVTDVSGDHVDARGHERGLISAFEIEHVTSDTNGSSWDCAGASYGSLDDAIRAQIQPGHVVAFHDAPDAGAWIAVVMVWAEAPGVRSADDEDGAALTRSDRLLVEHHELTAKAAARLVSRLPMSAPFSGAVAVGGPLHDAGKARECWQAAIGRSAGEPLAKSASTAFDFAASAGYRHELGSVVGAAWPVLQRHVVAGHHGWARPCFPVAALAHDGCLAAAGCAADDFGALHDHVGAWALAYVESVLKGADILAEVLADELAQDPQPEFGAVPALAMAGPAAKNWSTTANTRNPAEYFAALGVAALARRYLPGAPITLRWESGMFVVDGIDSDDVRRILARLCASTVRVVDAEEKWSALEIISADGVALPLRPWVADTGISGSRWKWSVGNTDGTSITRVLLKACSELLRSTEAMALPLFAQGSRLAHTDASTAKYRWDAVGSWGAVDTGYSLEAEGSPKSCRPWVELLSALGLQSFAQAPAGGNGWAYSTWSDPLSYVVAMAAVHGLHPSCNRRHEINTAKSGKNTDALLSQTVDVAIVAIAPVGITYA